MFPAHFFISPFLVNRYQGNQFTVVHHLQPFFTQRGVTTAVVPDLDDRRAVQEVLSGYGFFYPGTDGPPEFVPGEPVAHLGITDEQKNLVRLRLDEFKGEYQADTFLV